MNYIEKVISRRCLCLYCTHKSLHFLCINRPCVAAIRLTQWRCKSRSDLLIPVVIIQWILHGILSEANGRGSLNFNDTTASCRATSVFLSQLPFVCDPRIQNSSFLFAHLNSWATGYKWNRARGKKDRWRWAPVEVVVPIWTLNFHPKANVLPLSWI